MLKKLFCILLFLALSFRPVYHLSYIMYYECNIDYIVEKYCINKEEPEIQCNGKCHLAKKITLQNTNTEDKAIIGSFSEAFFPVFQENAFNYTCKELRKKEKVKKNWMSNSLHQLLLVCKDEQPPDFLV